MTPSYPPDCATVRVVVAVDPATAFSVFTEETDLWWRKGPRFRASGPAPGVLIFEPALGGRLLETFDAPDGPRVVVSGRIHEWDPPRRFAFEWRGANFEPGESTQVEVLFEPVAGGTAVTVRHWGWAGLPAGHPVRHGQDARGTIRLTGLWWAGLLNSLRERLALR